MAEAQIFIAMDTHNQKSLEISTLGHIDSITVDGSDSLRYTHFD